MDGRRLSECTESRRKWKRFPGLNSKLEFHPRMQFSNLELIPSDHAAVRPQATLPVERLGMKSPQIWLAPPSDSTSGKNLRKPLSSH